MQDIQKLIQNLVIVIIGDKGGIGKTLLAYNLIFWLLQYEPECELIDCDNDQFSSADFACLRKEAGIYPNLPIINVPTQELEKYLANSKKKAHIIEFGKSFGEDDKARRKALEKAVKWGDIILAPLPASPVDALAFGKFEEKLPVEIANKPAILIPNRVKSAKRLRMILNSVPQLQYFKISESFLSDRLCFQDSFLDNGRTIFEIKPKSDSDRDGIKEFNKLVEEIINTAATFYEG